MEKKYNPPPKGKEGVWSTMTSFKDGKKIETPFFISKETLNECLKTVESKDEDKKAYPKSVVNECLKTVEGNETKNNTAALMYKMQNQRSGR